jgi:hypothetical protein
MSHRPSKRTTVKVAQEWRLEGFDAFDGESYPISGGPWHSYEAVLMAAHARLAELELTQPSVNSGGQALGGIQDRVFIVHPSGRKERVVVRMSTDVVDLTVRVRPEVDLSKVTRTMPFNEDEPDVFVRTTFFAVDVDAIELFCKRWTGELTYVQVSDPHPPSAQVSPFTGH